MSGEGDRLWGRAAPLQVATLAALVGGRGNVAFALYDGSRYDLALLRFGFGAAAAIATCTWSVRLAPRCGP